MSLGLCMLLCNWSVALIMLCGSYLDLNMARKGNGNPIDGQLLLEICCYCVQSQIRLTQSAVPTKLRLIFPLHGCVMSFQALDPHWKTNRSGGRVNLRWKHDLWSKLEQKVLPNGMLESRANISGNCHGISVSLLYHANWPNQNVEQTLRVWRCWT